MRSILILFSLLSLTVFSFAQANPGEKEKLAAQYYAEGEYEKAAVLYQELYNTNPNTVIYRNYLDCLLALKDFRSAEKLVGREMKSNRDNARLAVDQAWVYEKSGRAEKAEKTYQKLLKNIPDNPASVMQLAQALEDKNYSRYAIELYKKARRQGKEKYYFELARIYGDNGQNKEMIAEYLSAILDDAQNTDRVKAIIQLKMTDDASGKIAADFKNELLDRVAKHPANLLYPELLYWYSLVKKDFKLAFIQVKALDRRLNKEGEEVFWFGDIAAKNKAYRISSQAYEYIMKKGEDHDLYLSAKIRLLDVKYRMITETSDFNREDIVSLEKEFNSTLQELGKHAGMIDIMLNLAHMQAFFLDKSDEAIALLNEILAYKNVKPIVLADAKLELADIYLMTGNEWEASLLYMQVDKAFKNDPLGAEAKFRNARLTFYIGEFDWARAQLDVLKAATTKLIANDAMQLSTLISDNIAWDSSLVPLQMYARADLMSFRYKYEDAVKTLDTIAEYFPGHPLQDEILMLKANIALKQNNDSMAIANLNEIKNTYSYDILIDDAIFMLANIYERKGENKMASENYKSIIMNHSNSIFAVEARKKFRLLRGDRQE